MTMIDTDKIPTEPPFADEYRSITYTQPVTGETPSGWPDVWESFVRFGTFPYMYGIPTDETMERKLKEASQ